MSDVSHSRHRQALWCGQCRRLPYDFLRPIRYSAWSICGFCRCVFNIYGRLVRFVRLVRCNVSTDPQLPDDWRQGSGNGRPALVKYLRHRSQPDREVPAVWWPQILILFGGHLLWTDEVGCLSWKQIAMQRSLGVYVLNFVQYGACLYLSVQNA